MEKHNNKPSTSYAFIRFLKESGAYIKFINNRGGIDRAKDYLRRGSGISYVSSAFSWSTAPEGHIFWMTIDGDWISVYMELQKALN